MRKRIKTLCIVSIVLSTVSFSGISMAYNLAGWRFFKCSTCSTASPTYKWGDRLDSGESLLKTAWKEAISDWERVQSKVDFSYNSESNSVLNSWYESGSSILGRMTTYRTLNYVSEFIGELNAGHPKITETNYARSTANHELGHAMGLDHTSNGSIMDSNRDRSVVYTPQKDDINGINAIYK